IRIGRSSARIEQQNSLSSIHSPHGFRNWAVVQDRDTSGRAPVYRRSWVQIPPDPQGSVAQFIPDRIYPARFLNGCFMATLNRLQKIFTHEGAPAARIDPLAQLERSVMSCLLWESEFYEDGQTIGERIADLVKTVPAADVARVAAQAKEDMRLRHVPPLLVRELMRTNEGRALAKGLFSRVV